MESHYGDYHIVNKINDSESHFIVDYYQDKWKEKDSAIEVDVLDKETLLNLGYDEFVDVPKMEECPLDEIESRMLDFMKNVMSPIIDLNKYEVK